MSRLRFAGLPAMFRRAGVLRKSAVPAKKDQLFIFDTTLRDGEQSPGVTLQTDQKIVIARQLSKLGVDICEAGFPIASEGDFAAVNSIASEIGPLVDNRSRGPMRIAGLSRANKKDIQRCFDAVSASPRYRIHTFIATSDIHLQYKLKMSREQCLEAAAEHVRFACQLIREHRETAARRDVGGYAAAADDKWGGDVEFSAEDAGRTDLDFLVDVCNAAIEAGATTLNIPDTVGYNTPLMYQELFAALKARCVRGDEVIWSSHCHNDLGLATANALAAVDGGARQIECTVNGIGERAGNTALEEVVMALRVHPSRYAAETAIDTTLLFPTSRLIVAQSGMMVQANKSIVGANAFAHESGIHQHGHLAHASTYEIISPKDIGLSQSNLVLGKLSGRAALIHKLKEFGFSELSDEQMTLIFKRFKNLCDTKRTVHDDDLLALANEVVAGIAASHETWSFLGLHVSSFSSDPSGMGDAMPSAATASVRLLYHGPASLGGSKQRDGQAEIPAADSADDATTDSPQMEHFVDAATGNGPVSAVLRAINRITNIPAMVVEEFEVRGIGPGRDAQGEVSLRIALPESEEGSTPQAYPRTQADWATEPRRRTYIGHGVGTDIVGTAARAYLEAVNRYLYDMQQREGRQRAQ
eukprot:TRINITY_DN46108_c0_g1_i1.p1 TRINITY_DN46108_c0_g1~~TRINITY_DN46108_c0_g1_i1.p1  ORF type:complete len:642 (-),score=153.12 TRINITY_DN46108_c0_g1_i1:378-2303(-)